MIGLLRKDLYMTWAYCRTFLLLLLVFLGVGAVNGDNAFFTVYPMIIGMMLPVSLVSYDERFHWSRACDTLPCTRAQVVVSKYLLTLLSVLTVLLLTLLVHGFRLARQGSLAELWGLIPLLLPIGLLGPSLLLPVIFRMGVEKGRLFYYIIVGVVCALGVMMGSSIPLPQINASGTLSSPVLVLASFLIFAASCLLSIRLYEKREL